MAEPHSLLPVKAVPNAPRNQIVGWLGDALKIKLHAPPVEGKANAELCGFLAQQLGISKRAVSIATGDTSRQKRVRIEGLLLTEVRQRIDRLSREA